ncbi:hypothetical protein PtB15_7B538 [Puccinia triticina]|nr:hypothetical protein PtB15_7B538 [Puccinia triticina]
MSATGLPSGRRFLKIHILVPMLMNLKANLEMNLTAWLSNSNLYPRVCGQTNSATRPLYNLSKSAYTNLCTIESFINHTHQSLSSGLAILVDWIRTEIMDCFKHQLPLDSGLLTASLMIQLLFKLLKALATFIHSCQEGTNKCSQENVVYHHLDLHIRQCSSSLIQGVFSWLLDRLCAALLIN